MPYGNNVPSYDTGMKNWGTPAASNPMNPTEFKGLGIPSMPQVGIETPAPMDMSFGTSDMMGTINDQYGGSIPQYIAKPVGGIGGEEPAAMGNWLKGGQLALGAGKLGLGVYSALEAAKMNKFMRGYYGDQMDLQQADFANAARSTNEALSSRRERQLDSRGMAIADTAQSKAMVDDYMKKHGVDESA